ncbi:MAG: rhomboid family protein [Candidatus Hydrogenedentes bacterium]|nr:rhomboid family protein [Candidatus Hydrogenedentota bacterium]
MAALAEQRCFNHAVREAAARCLDCKRFFCRECVTEHAGRMLCALCLVKASQSPQARRRARAIAVLVRPAQVAASVLFLWLVFYAIGQGLLMLPDTFHKQDLWQSSVWDDSK